jgi:hypothetical protein
MDFAMDLNGLMERPFSKRDASNEEAEVEPKRQKVKGSSSRYGVRTLTVGGKTNWSVSHIWYEGLSMMTVELLKSRAFVPSVGDICAIQVKNKFDDKLEFVYAIRICDKDNEFLGYRPLGFKHEHALLPELNFSNEVVLTGAALNNVISYGNRLPLCKELEQKRELLEGMGFVSDQHLKKYFPKEEAFEPAHVDELLYNESGPYIPSQMLNSLQPERAEQLASSKFIADEPRSDIGKLRNTHDYQAASSIVAAADGLQAAIQADAVTFTTPKKKKKSEPVPEKPKKSATKSKKAEPVKEKKVEPVKEKKAEPVKEKKVEPTKAKKVEPVKEKKPAEAARALGEVDFVHMKAMRDTVATMKKVSSTIAAKYTDAGHFNALLERAVHPIVLLDMGSQKAAQEGEATLACVVLYEYWMEKLNIKTLHAPLLLKEFLKDGSEELLELVRKEMRLIDAMKVLVRHAATLGTPDFCLKFSLQLGGKHSEEYVKGLKRHTALLYNLSNDVDALLAEVSEENVKKEEEDPFAV